MRIAILTAEEAASPEVMKNLAEHFLDSEVAARPAVVAERLAAVAAAPTPEIVAKNAGFAAAFGDIFQSTFGGVAGPAPVLDTDALIGSADNLSTGARFEQLSAAAPDLRAIFGGASAPLPPLLAALPTAPLAAVVAPPLTALVVPPASGPAPAAPAPVQLLAPVAPAQPAPVPPAVSASAVEGKRDGSGLPWDGRIHASSQTLTAEGVWRKKRGVEPEIMQAIESDLRAVMALPSLAPAAGPPAPTLQHPGEDFTQFSLWISSQMIAGKISVGDIAAAVSDSGLKSLPDLMHRTDLIPVVRARFEQLSAAR